MAALESISGDAAHVRFARLLPQALFCPVSHQTLTREMQPRFRARTKKMGKLLGKWRPRPYLDSAPVAGVLGMAGRATILVIEDEMKVAAALKKELEGERYEVVVTTTGEDGFFHANSEVFDLIVLDVHLARLRKKVDQDFFVKLIHTVRGVGVILCEGEP